MTHKKPIAAETCHSHEFKVGACWVEVYADAFIPMRAVRNPLYSIYPWTYFEFEGDGRDFEYRGRSRLWNEVVVNTCGSGELDFHHCKGVGETIGSYYDHYYRRPTDYDIYSATTSGNLAPAAGTIGRTVKQDRATESDEGLKAKLLSRGRDCSVLIQMRGSGNNALVPGSFDVDYSYKIKLSCDTAGFVRYASTGVHDGFPAYSLYISRTLVHAYDPRVTGQGPLTGFIPIVGSQQYLHKIKLNRFIFGPPISIEPMRGSVPPIKPAIAP